MYDMRFGGCHTHVVTGYSVCTGACVVQNFLVCFEMFVAALAHHKYYNFKVRSFLSMPLPPHSLMLLVPKAHSVPRRPDPPGPVASVVVKSCRLQEFKMSTGRASFKKAVKELLPSDLTVDAVRSMRKASIFNPMLSPSITSLPPRSSIVPAPPDGGSVSRMSVSRAVRTSAMGVPVAMPRSGPLSSVQEDGLGYDTLGTPVDAKAIGFQGAL